MCLNVCVNTPSGLMCSVEFWLHLGSTETHRQHRLRSNTHTETCRNTHLRSPTCVSFHLFLSRLSFSPLCLSLFLSCRCLGLTHTNRWTKLKHTHSCTHAHTHWERGRELQASQLSACCCLSEAESSSLFQSVGTSASFRAVWKNLTLIFNKVRKTIFLRLYKVSSQNKRGSSNAGKWTSFPLLNVEPPLQAARTLFQILVGIQKGPKIYAYQAEFGELHVKWCIHNISIWCKRCSYKYCTNPTFSSWYRFQHLSFWYRPSTDPIPVCN